ncbi:MAG: substrate-binding domain-containing protein, partial [Spirochaetia bacterium]|nr:substrate-binding domain-containing protein [Spirochaetia bacterium]
MKSGIRVPRSGESREEATKEGPRIAFMLASIHSGSATKVWPEIWQESEKRRSVLFIFPGGRLSSRDEYEYMRNGIFDLVKVGNFDGTLCWASSLSGFASESEVERFLESNLTMPMVTFGLKIGKRPVVNIDAYTGMKDLIFHLLKKHGCRRIAYLGGPKAHSSAEDRFRAYRDALNDQGIGLDDTLTVLDNPWTEGRRAMELLLDERRLRPGEDFDALCSASDLLSFEAAALLRERGYSIPGDIALGGFNDSDESNLLSPTFTTVHMPFERQAVQALRMLLELLSGKKPKDKLLRTNLVVRQSCGCRTKAVQMAGSRKRIAHQAGISSDPLCCAKADDKYSLQANDKAELLRATLKVVGLSPEEGAGRMESLITTLLERINGKAESPFLDNLDELLDNAITQERDLGVFQNLLSILRTSLEPYAADPARHTVLESLIGQGRVLVSEAEKRLSTFRIWQERKLDHWLSILSHELLCAKDFDGIVGIAARCLPPLGIKEAYFVLNGEDSSRRVLLGGFKPRAEKSGSARLYKGSSGRRSFSSDRLLPEELFPREPGTFVVLPLYFESTSLGYAILSVGRKNAYVYEEIRTQLSSALRGVLLFEQADSARRRAEKAERMKSQFLAGISGELQEPLKLIHQTALERLNREDGETAMALRKIAASSARQLDLTKNLLEYSLAQVEDLPLNSGLIKPSSMLRELLSIADGNAALKGWGQVELGGAGLADMEALPLIWGDKARLRQGMEIFIDVLFRESGSRNVLLDAFPGERGLKISATARNPGGEAR